MRYYEVPINPKSISERFVFKKMRLQLGFSGWHYCERQSMLCAKRLTVTASKNPGSKNWIEGKTKARHLRSQLPSNMTFCIFGTKQ